MRADDKGFVEESNREPLKGWLLAGSEMIQFTLQKALRLLSRESLGDRKIKRRKDCEEAVVQGEDKGLD